MLVANMVKHSESCKRCEKCGHSYFKKHDKKICDAYKREKIKYYKNNHIISGMACDQQYTCEDAYGAADFETFNKLMSENKAKKTVPYAFAYSIKGFMIPHAGINRTDFELITGDSEEEIMDKVLDVILMLSNLTYVKDGNVKESRLKFNMIMYNSSGFDAYFILNAMLNSDKFEKSEIRFLLHSGRFKKITYRGFTIFDLCQHTISSLKDACIGYGIGVEKGDFDHNKINSYEDAKKYKNEWLPYLQKDIECTNKLYEVYCDQFFRQHQLNVCDYVTNSSSAVAKWQTTLSEIRQDEDGENKTIYDHIDLPNHEQSVFINRATYGGGCHPIKKKFDSPEVMEKLNKLYSSSEVLLDGCLKHKANEISEEELYTLFKDFLVDLDVCSMYPAALHGCTSINKLINGMYPTKIMKEFEKDPKKLKKLMTQINNSILGDFFIAEVDVQVNKKLLLNPLPRKYEKEGKLNYQQENEDILVNPNGNMGFHDLSDITKQCYTNLDLYRAVKLGCKVTKIHRVLFFGNPKQIFKQFVAELFINKDSAKFQGNKAVELISKILLNALYGKQGMRPVITKNVIINSDVELQALLMSDNFDRIRFFQEHHDKDGKINRIYVQYDVYDKDAECQMPSYNASFCLSYSRMLLDTFMIEANMYTNIENMYFYRDTDSMIVKWHVYEKILKKYKKPTLKECPKKGDAPHGLGYLDFDIAGPIIAYRGFLPKAYTCYFIHKSDDKNCKNAKHIGRKEGCKKGQLCIHIRVKGIERSLAGKLRINDFDNLISGKQISEYELNGNTKVEIFKRISMRLNSTTEEYGACSIVRQNISRTLNKDSHFRRCIDTNDEYLSTYPVLSELNPIKSLPVLKNTKEITKLSDEEYKTYIKEYNDEYVEHIKVIDDRESEQRLKQIKLKDSAKVIADLEKKDKKKTQ